MLKKIAFSLTIISLISLTACNKLTQENYSKLTIGMERNQVESLLGKPVECQNILAAMNCTWQEGESSINIQFLNNKIITFVANKLK